MQTQKIKLSGLTCSACKKVTEKRIGSLNGVKRVEVVVDSGIATIEADREITVTEIKEAFKNTPYGIRKE